MNSQSKSIQSSYETLKQQISYTSCPGACSCDLGGRSAYDQKQYAEYVCGKNPFNFPQSEKPPGLFPQKCQENFQNSSGPLQFTRNISNSYALYDQSNCKQYLGPPGESFCEKTHGPEYHYVKNADSHGEIQCCKTIFANAQLLK